MPKGIHISQDVKDDILMKVALYQSEQKCTLKESFKVMSKECGVAPNTVAKWYHESKGKNPVISKVAKKIAATSITTPATTSMLVEKAIYDHIKSLNFIQRLFCIFIKLDKLCPRYTHSKILKK